MGLRDEAEKLISDQRAAAAEADRRYRDQMLSGVPDAIRRWCRDALDVDAPESYEVLRDGESGYDTTRWYAVEVEFQLEDILFAGSVTAYNGSSYGSLEAVRVKKPGGSPGPIVTSKQTLAYALEFHARY